MQRAATEAADAADAAGLPPAAAVGNVPLGPVLPGAGAAGAGAAATAAGAAGGAAARTLGAGYGAGGGGGGGGAGPSSRGGALLPLRPAEAAIGARATGMPAGANALLQPRIDDLPPFEVRPKLSR